MKMVDGQYTKRLAKLIPIDNIKAYCYIYSLMIQIRISEKLTDKIFSKIEKVHRNILGLIRDLKRSGWISETNYNTIKDVINIDEKKKIRAYVNEFLSKKRDRPFEFLIYALIYDIRHYNRNNPHYQEVIDFLDEQEIKKPVPTYETLAQMYNRSREEEVRLSLDFYLMLLEGTELRLPVDGVHEGFLIDQIRIWRKINEQRRSSEEIELPKRPMLTACNLDVANFMEWLQTEKGIDIPSECLFEWCSKRPQQARESIEVMEEIMEELSIKKKEK